MKLTYKLLKIDGYWIIVSDEKYSENTWILGITPKDSQYKFANEGKIIYNKLPEPFADQEAFRKIIASQNPSHNLHTITFSDEVAKELGIVEPMILAREATIMNNYDSEDDTFKHGFVVGYNQALSDNKDKLFTLEDMKEFAKRCMIIANEIDNIGRLEKFIDGQAQSLTQQQWKIELEMELIDKTKEWSAFSNPLINLVKEPKVTNNSVKVTKIIKK